MNSSGSDVDVETVNNSWRDRYLAALDEHERELGRFRDWSELLTRALVRVSLAADGNDRDLDKLLAELRRLIRADDTPEGALARAVENLDSRIKALDGQRQDQLAQLRAHFSALAQQLSGLKPGLRQRLRLQRLQRDLQRRTERLPELSELIGEWVALQGELLPERSRGKWWRGKPGSDAPVEQDSAPDRVRPVKNSSVKGSPVEHAGVEEEEEEEYAADLGESLARLVTLIPEVKSQATLRQRLRKQLDEPLTPGMLEPLLRDISLLLAAALDVQQSEFQEFLVALDQRLRHAAELLHGAADHSQQRLDAGGGLQSSVHGEVSALRHQLEGASDLNQLKTAIESRLEAIVGAVDSYQREELAREASEQERIAALVTRMHELEEQTQTVRRELVDQRLEALRDDLTRLPNRRAFDERAAQEYQRWQRYGHPLTLAIADLDHFKQVNDRYGHLAGDKVLRIAARALAERLRGTDFIARYGGEEFVLLLPETGAEPASRLLDELRQAIAGCPFHFKDERVPVTVSIGYTSLTEGDTMDQAFERADRALYQAKNEGRDNLVASS